MNIYERNRRIYDGIWKHARLRDPRRFNTWPVVEEAVQGSSRLLEIGPGLRPRLPLGRSVFIDVSPEATRRLRAGGADAVLGNIRLLPFAAASFDFVSALDVVEHAAEPERVFEELARVLVPGGRLLLSTPLNSRSWSRFDAAVGHSRRFDSEELAGLLRANGLEALRTSPFGVLPRSRALVSVGAWVLERFPRQAIWFEDRIVLPLSGLIRKPLRWQEGFHVPARAAGVILLCLRRS